MGRIVAVSNQKGGVGKTTTAINLAASLAAAEKRVLVVDLDPQSNATTGLGHDPRSGAPSVYQVLIEELPIETVVRETAMPTLYLAPSCKDLTALEVELVDQDARESRLKRALASVRSGYDYLLVDSPPSLGLLTLNVLTAADTLLIPIQCEYLALEGVTDLLGTYQRVRGFLNPGLGIEGVLMTMFDERTNLSHQVVQEIRNYFGDKVFHTMIPRNVRLGEAPSFGKPVMLYDVRSRGAEAYLELAREILRNEKKGARSGARGADSGGHQAGGV